MSARLALRPRRATYDDLARVPHHQVAQILDGELVVLPRPTAEHADTLAQMTADLRARFRRGGGDGGTGGWWILPEVEIHLGEDVVVPDVSGWRRSRMSVRPTGPFQTLPPDWICEIQSPSTRAIDRVRKMALYAREGVGHCWLADPEARTLEVFRLEASRWTRVSAFEGAEVVRAEPFDEAEFALGRWWGDEGGGEDGAGAWTEGGGG